MTATYAVTPSLNIGIEVNPLDDDVGPLLTWRAIDETEDLPALIFGTSSDRIGTPSGRAYFATFAKDIESWTGLPIAPYLGTSYGEFLDEFELIGGLRVRWAEGWSSTHLWDGVNLHHVVNRRIGDRWRLGVVAAEQDGEMFYGLSLGASLGGGPSITP